MNIFCHFPVNGDISVLPAICLNILRQAFLWITLYQLDAAIERLAQYIVREPISQELFTYQVKYALKNGTTTSMSRYHTVQWGYVSYKPHITKAFDRQWKSLLINMKKC